MTKKGVREENCPGRIVVREEGGEVPSCRKVDSGGGFGVANYGRRCEFFASRLDYSFLLTLHARQEPPAPFFLLCFQSRMAREVLANNLSGADKERREEEEAKI